MVSFSLLAATVLTKVALATNAVQNWAESGTNYQFNSGSGGQYSVNWSPGGGFVVGKGWNPGGRRTIVYSGTYNTTGPGYLALYGWSTNPLIEFYVVDSYGALAPNEPWTLKGNFTSDGGTYQQYISTRVNKPSIQGTTTFNQFWSVRTEHRVGGTITSGNHFDQWSKLGMNLGNINYMVIAVEGYTNGNQKSQGSANINVEG